MTDARGYALITGASSGIGEALAEALADRGQPLILVARRVERLTALAERLRRRGVAVETVPADLTAAGACEALARRTAEAGWTVSLLVNNAGVGSGGDFAALPIAREIEIVDLNVRAVVELTHHYLPRLRAQGGGAIIHISSAAAFQPMPFMASYAASKAFELSFSLALWRENRRHGVHVLAVCPGTTATGFFEAAGLRRRQRGVATAAEVAAIALRALDRRAPLVICGAPNRLLVAAGRIVPRRLLLAVAARYTGHGRD